MYTSEIASGATATNAPMSGNTTNAVARFALRLTCNAACGSAAANSRATSDTVALVKVWRITLMMGTMASAIEIVATPTGSNKAAATQASAWPRNANRLAPRPKPMP